MQEIDSVIIAKFFPIANLGVYKRAKTLRDFPVNFIFGGVNSVLYPAMTKIQDDNKRLIKYYSGIIHILSFILVPLSFILAIIAKPVIVLLLTEKWVDVIPYFQILMPIGFTIALSGLNVNIITAKGDTKFLLKFEFFKRIIFSIVTIVSLYWGIMTFVIALSGLTLIFFFINLYYGGKYIKFTLIKQLKIIVPYFILSVGVSIVAYFTFNLFSSYWLQLIIPSVICLSLYFFISNLLNLNGYRLLINEILLPLLNKKKTKK
jgi:O-antigen/teichoic acid export membrane protein